MYNPKIIEHFKNPKNQGTIADASGIGEVGNPVCGDMMKIYIKVDKDPQGQEIIKDVKFETLGCAAAIANSSILTEMAMGKTLDDALKITREDVVKELGGLPPSKLHCSVLAVDGLQKAVEDYKLNN